jgi:hypothetical protein
VWKRTGELKAIKLAILLAMVLSGSGVASAQIRVFAQVGTSKPIYVGEQFSYYVVIDNHDRAGEVDILPLAKFDPQRVGQRDQSEITMQGGRTVTVYKRYVILYKLTAGQAGVMRLPSVDVTIDGKKYKTNPVNVTVAKPGSTELMDAEIQLSTRKCYVGQPVLMTVKWYIQANQAGAVGAFNFNVPVLDSGLCYVEDTDEALKNRRQNARSVNGQPVTLFQRQTKRKGVDSVEVFFTKVLIPKQFGTIEIKPASLSVDVAVGQSRRTRNSFLDSVFSSPRDYKRFMVSSKPTTLEVLAVPEKGKPKDFYGLVGNYTITSSATPTQVNVGDPITLTVKVGGSKYLKPVETPDLMSIAAMAENFKISSEQNRPVIENGSKVFTYTIRAKHDKVAAIPAIGLSYFDAKSGKYATVKSKPVKLNVAATKVITQADIEGNDVTVFGKSVEAAKVGISAHYEGLEALKDQRFSPTAALISPGFALLWGGPLALLIFSAFAKMFTHTTPEKIAARRRKSAFRNAVKAAMATQKHSGSDASELLASAMKQYVADKFGRIAKSLTAADCSGLISASVSDMGIAHEYKRVIESCEAGTYSGADVKYEPALVAEVIAMMRKIEKGAGR